MNDFETIAKELPIQKINKDQFADMIHSGATFIAYIEDKIFTPKGCPDYFNRSDFPLFEGFHLGRYEGWLHGSGSDFLERSIEFLKSDEWGKRPLFYVTQEAAIPFNIESLI